MSASICSSPVWTCEKQVSLRQVATHLQTPTTPTTEPFTSLPSLFLFFTSKTPGRLHTLAYTVAVHSRPCIATRQLTWSSTPTLMSAATSKALQARQRLPKIMQHEHVTRSRVLIITTKVKPKPPERPALILHGLRAKPQGIGERRSQTLKKPHMSDIQAFLLGAPALAAHPI